MVRNSRRNGTFSAGGQTFTVTQAAGCTFSINPTSQNVAASAGKGSTSVTAPAGCGWTATSNDPSFLTITSGASGTGPGTTSFTIAANPGPQRTGTLTVAGQTFTVTQAGGCSFTIDPTSSSPGASAGSGSVAITASSSTCQWSTTNNTPSFLTITSGASGTGNGTTSYSFTANTGPQRTGTLTIAGQTFTVTQAGGCSFTINPTSNPNVVANGGSGSVTITASSSTCQWSTTNNAPSFLTITSGASGTGNGQTNYSVAANSGPQRTGTLTIAGQTFTVTQASGCSFTINPTSNPNVGANGGSGNVSVTASSSTCPWTTTNNAPSFLTITNGASGTGNGQTNYSVAENTGPQRTGTLTIAGQTFTVTQANGCTLTISPPSASYLTAGGSGSITVTTTNGCAWTAVASDSWITITSGASGNTSGTINYTVGPSAIKRSGAITITLTGTSTTRTHMINQN